MRVRTFQALSRRSTPIARSTGRLGRIRHDGLRATGRAALRRVRKLVYLHEEHIWYQCDLAEDRPRRELPAEVRFIRAEPAQTDIVAELGQSSEQARERLEAGNDLWLVLEDDGDPLFACYTFRRSAPVLAAPNRTLLLPPETASLEDSVTSPAARGRGIAPGAWTRVCDELQRAGFTALITKIETANAPSRRAVEKAGFREVAVMRHTRVATRRRTTVRRVGEGLGGELAARLT
jgi:RimJ/RimL family protein N-acetyltransferase